MVAIPQELEHDEFRAWVQQVLRPRMLDRQIKAGVFDRALGEAHYLPDVLERQANQKEFTLPIWDYLGIAASEDRIRKGRAMFRKHRALLGRIEQSFAVEPEVVTAIWGLETGYGTIRGSVPVISALATLAFRGRRAAFFEDELVAALRLVQTRGCAPAELIGSWAGAIGHGQFMPSSVLGFAVDFDEDGKPNICGDDPTDSLASIAHYLAKHNWKRGQPWGLEVRLPEGFDHGLSGVDQSRATEEFSALGVSLAVGAPLPDYGPASILLPAGAEGPAFLVLRNFHVILRYNRSEAYALGIGLLSDRIVGGRPLRARWPTGGRVLTQRDIGEVQYLLTQAGFETGGIDGLRGPNTARAVRSWQAARGLVADGYLSEALLDRLRDEAAGEGGEGLER